MDDQHAQFLIMVGDAFVAAALAELPLEVVTSDGNRISGVPALLEAVDRGAEVDHTGYPSRFRLDAVAVALEDIVEYIVRSPTPSGSDVHGQRAGEHRSQT
ncbi:MAG: hypothetical protein WAK93_16285 [Solirubrobacteraceae bacterium]